MQRTPSSLNEHDKNSSNCVIVENTELISQPHNGNVTPNSHTDIQPDNGTVTSSPNTELIINQPNAPAFGSISVVNSEDVHFGNKTYLNGPITIKNLITSSIVNSLPKDDSEVLSKKIICIKHQKTIVFVLVFLIVLLLILYITIVKTVEYYQKNVEELNTHEGPPYIASHILRFVSRDDWLAQPVEGPLDPLEHPTPWVIIAHTAAQGCTTQSECILRVRTVQTFHIESKRWYDIGYNFLIGGDGSVYEGRGWDHIGAHTLGYNNISICIAFIGTYNKIEPTQNQLSTCQKLIELGVKLGKLSQDYKLLGHRQLTSWLSPGDELFNIIEQWPHFVQNASELTPYFNNV